MKRTSIIILFFITWQLPMIYSQTPISQVEGYLEVYHPGDTTSLYIGNGSGQSVSGLTNPNSNNTFVGASTGANNTTGANNSFFGSSAGAKIFFGTQNSFFGSKSGTANHNGSGNSFIGAFSGMNNIDGYDNSFLGFEAGQDHIRGDFNCFFGSLAGTRDSIGSYNSFFGGFSGFNNKSGKFNSFFGSSAGRNITTQDRVIALGYYAGPTVGEARDSALYIDIKQTNDPLIYGEFNNDLVRINGSLQLGGIDYSFGGDDGVLRSPGVSTGDLFIVSNDAVIVEIADSAANNGVFEIWNGAINDWVFQVKENGDVHAEGNITADGTINGSSDINRKEAITRIDTHSILKKVAAMPISEWQYKSSPDRHIGPMAQDFYAAFGLGQGETTIATVDADGVALAAIQALAKENEELKKRIARLESLLLEE